MPTIFKLDAIRCPTIVVRISEAVFSSSRLFFPTAPAICSPGKSIRLRRVYRLVQERRPFETIAICILPDHLHALWALPEQDSDFAGRWSLIKGGFSRGIEAQPRSQSQTSKREKGIWQRRYWEHAIRSDADLERHVGYIHFNPVKHSYVTRVADWPHSSFHRHVERGMLPADWGGDMKDIPGSFGE